MKCLVCGYGGEAKEACPRCGATGASLLDIPALAQGPAYEPDALDLTRDEVGFTNPNLHVRMDKHISGNYETIDYPPSYDVGVDAFTINDEQDTIIKYLSEETSPKIPELLPKNGIKIIGAGAFVGTDVYFVDIPEGITEIE